jgi:hypothetical protein
VLVADDHRLIVNAIRIALDETEDIEIVAAPNGSGTSKILLERAGTFAASRHARRPDPEMAARVRASWPRSTQWLVTTFRLPPADHGCNRRRRRRCRDA